MSPKERLTSLDLLAVLLGHLSPWVDMSTVLYVSHFHNGSPYGDEVNSGFKFKK
jgi:hypothetical protein